jgi:glucosamine--fructose-6-phosphate aminotransferase (isomerizing)
MTQMMKEVAEQPAALLGLRKYYTSPGAISFRALRKLVKEWPPTVVFTGMGSSLYAALPAQAYLNSLGIRALVWEAAELLHYHLKFLGSDTLLVAVSQSGETIEVTRLLEEVPPRVGVIAVTNVESSTLARRGNLWLPMMAGTQKTVSTKTYMCAVAMLMYLAFAIARRPHRLLTHALKQAVESQEEILGRQEILIPPLAEFFDEPAYSSLMSRGPDLASVYQGAQMLKEVARLGAEPTSAAQFRHGPVEIIQPPHRYVVFARQGRTGKILLNIASHIQRNGGRVVLLTDMAFGDTTNLRLVPVPSLKLGLGTLVDVLYIQLLAHELAVRAGRDPGKFWLATMVTREE